MVPSFQEVLRPCAPRAHLPTAGFQPGHLHCLPRDPDGPRDLCSGLLCPQGASRHLMGLGPCSLPARLTGPSPRRKGFHLFAARNTAWRIAGAQRPRTGPRTPPPLLLPAGVEVQLPGREDALGRVDMCLFLPVPFLTRQDLRLYSDRNVLKGNLGILCFLEVKVQHKEIKTRIPALDKQDK